jgi:hypothetical protein
VSRLEQFTRLPILLSRLPFQAKHLGVAQNEALQASSDALKDGLSAAAALWNGTPWRMWVTDKPNGEGKTFFTLRLSVGT